jgi:hypothetical protein
MHTGISRGLLVAALCVLFLTIQPFNPAVAEPSREEVKLAAEYVDRLKERGIIDGVSKRGDALVVRALKPLLGADDKSLSDVARAVARSRGFVDDTHVVFVDPDGKPFASFRRSTSLVRG